MNVADKDSSVLEYLKIILVDYEVLDDYQIPGKDVLCACWLILF